ncbi:MAG: tRNA (N6-isopentenyl adenosine(37)-C2)-methylthiotransferase MiaB [Micavibrio aeruginosavorus]|nr:tRNA (N6-isopentenyl adenosine(37)-C2)-methylthiotransferase MiaB [Micavibrio aeruginosavorus]
MTASATKKLYIKTWGCQMNVYDSNRMADILHPLGYRAVDTPDDADMVILNTCHIREKATDKVFSDLGRMRDHKNIRKAKGKKTLIAVAGCVAQAEGDVILERAPYVDMVFGPQAYHELPEMIIRATGERVINTDLGTDSKFDSLPADHAAQDGPTAFLSIQEGCDKFCTFCVVPYTRGAEYSRPAEDILNEAKRLRDRGVVEITLLGQNVNAWHGDGADGLGGLIARIADIDGIARIRYMTSHPRDMDDTLIDAHRDIRQLMPFLHLPVQSGSDEILKTMNRKHTADHYRDIIARVRKARPDIALSSDFIVGFPGETEKHFEETLQLIRDIGFTTSYSFKYSARPGTPAANMQGLIPEKVKDERVQRIQELLFAQHTAFNTACIGQTLDVLMDGYGRGESQLHGRTPYNQAIHITTDRANFGKILPVRITAATATSVSGEIVA